MKKLTAIIGIYTVLVFALCLGLSAALIETPILLPGEERLYLFLNGILRFLDYLPGIFLSGFTVACAVIWQKKTGNSFSRFSQGMFSRYRIALFASLGLVLLLTFNEEVFRPAAEKKLESMEYAAVELSDALVAAHHLLTQGHPVLSYQYAKKAVKISPGSQPAADMLKKAQDAMDIMRDREIHGKKKDSAEKIKREMHSQNAGHTIRELLAKSDEAARKKQWFDAHYWAQLAVEACSGTNTNLPDAVEKANYAWEMISRPVAFDNSEEKAYYQIKKDGYTAFNSGDSLKAYYTFTSLKNAYPAAEKDPDVQKFLALSQEEVESQYFFFDETDYLNRLSSSHQIYFSLHYGDGSKYVFSILNAMDMKKEGGLVRYLEDFHAVHYDKDNNFMYSLSVPYAKAIAVPVSEFDEKDLLLMGIDKKWKFVPMIVLQSIDRNTEGLISKPSYSFAPSGLPDDIMEDEHLSDPAEKNRFPAKSFVRIDNSSMMILPMPFSDFHLINEASSGAKRMSLVSLKKFLPRAAGYGFSKEVFIENLVHRGTFPFVLLVMFIFCACLGWNYRIENPHSVFKFKWLALVPLFGMVMTAFFRMVLYFFNVLNYIFVGMFGLGAVPVAAAAYAFLFLAVSVLFLSRKT